MRKPFKEFIEKEIKNGFLLIACGLPGTAKSGVTEMVRRAKGGRMLCTDIIRLEVLKDHDVFDSKVAGDMKKRTQVYDVMFEQADEAFSSEKNVILDATFVMQALRQRAAAIAAKHKATFIIAQTDCPEDIAIKRILARDKDNYESNALTEEAYRDNKHKFEAVDLDALKKQNPGLKLIHLVVDTAQYSPDEWRVTIFKKR